MASVLYSAEKLVKVNNGHIITSIINSREQDVGVPNPVVTVINIRDRDVGETAVIGLTEQENCRDDPGQSRGERLKTDHLNSEEKKSLHVLYFDYEDVFLAGRQIKLHKRGQAYYTFGAGFYPYKYTTLLTTRNSKGRGRPTSKSAT